MATSSGDLANTQPLNVALPPPKRAVLRPQKKKLSGKKIAWGGVAWRGRKKEGLPEEGDLLSAKDVGFFVVCTGFTLRELLWAITCGFCCKECLVQFCLSSFLRRCSSKEPEICRETFFEIFFATNSASAKSHLQENVHSAGILPCCFELLGLWPVQFINGPRRVAETWFTRPGFSEHVLPWQSQNKERVHKIFQIANRKRSNFEMIQIYGKEGRNRNWNHSDSNCCNFKSLAGRIWNHKRFVYLSSGVWTRKIA